VIRRVLALLVAGLVLTACSSGGKSSSTSSGLNDRPNSQYQGFGLTPPQPRPAFTLTDTTGASYSFSTATQGRPTFLYFGYTQCPDVCPTTMADIGIALKTVPAAVRDKAIVVFVTTDVAHDTGPVIAQWLSAFKEGVSATYVGLYGSQAQVDAAQAAAHVALASDEGKTHSAQVLLYGSDDYARVSYAQSDNEADAIAHDLPVVSK
jgi:protein SCO1/2